jgi:transposase
MAAAEATTPEEGADMAKARTLVGLDVHASKVVAAVLDAETGELRFRRVAGGNGPALALCGGLEGPVRVAYEAGPTGFGLARELATAGVECVVAAPGKIPRGAQDRVKTDRRDAEHLVRLLLAGKLEPVRVPSPEEEALRDLVRAREDLRGDLMRARHRVSKMLLRHGMRFSAGGRAWSVRHRAWLARVELADPVAQLVLSDYVAAVEALLIRRDALERQIAERVPASPWSELVPRLRCLHGIDTLSAVGLCAEIGDFDRFQRPGELMSYLGLVPSERSTGERRRLGAITKSGSRHARRLLVEAAWHYRPGPRPGRELAKRQAGQPEQLLAIAWKAQKRLHRTWRRLEHERGKRRTVVAVAVARELAGFCWAIATA